MKVRKSEVTCWSWVPLVVQERVIVQLDGSEVGKEREKGSGVASSVSHEAKCLKAVKEA